VRAPWLSVGCLLRGDLQLRLVERELLDAPHGGVPGLGQCGAVELAVELFYPLHLVPIVRKLRATRTLSSTNSFLPPRERKEPAAERERERERTKKRHRERERLPQARERKTRGDAANNASKAEVEKASFFFLSTLFF